MIRLIIIAALSLLIASCEEPYYRPIAEVGRHKKEILARQIEQAAAADKACAEQFRLASASISAAARDAGATPKDVSMTVSQEVRRCDNRSKLVHDRLAAAENDAGYFFTEWDRELSDYVDRDLRETSAAAMKDCRARFDAVMEQLKLAEESTQPVMDLLSDQALLLHQSPTADAVVACRAKSGLLGVRVDAANAALNGAAASAGEFAQRLRTPTAPPRR